MNLPTLKPWQRYLLAALAGVVLALAFPNAGVAGLAWVAPGLFVAVASGTRGKRAWRLGWTAGFASALVQLNWLLCIPVTGFPILGWAALSAYVGLFTATWVWFVNWLDFWVSGWRQRTLWTLTGAAAWVALEFMRCHFLTGFPWNPLGASQWKLTPLVQIASVTGVHGVSFLIVFTSLGLFNAVRAIVRHPERRRTWQAEIFLPLLVVALVFAGGALKLRTPEVPVKMLRVAAVQPAIPQTMIWDSRENTNRFNQLLALSETAATNCDLLLWPEAALPEFNESTFAAMRDLVRRHHVWMIFGADDVLPSSSPDHPKGYEFYNSACLLTPEGEAATVYHKQNLVIFGEFIPFLHWLPFLKYLSPIGDSYSAGEYPGQFNLGGEFRLAPLICFEDIFAATARRSVNQDTDLLLNLTNDGWFGFRSAQRQHAAAASFRAIENGRPLLRSCNTGLTCWFDARGQLRETFHDDRNTIYGPGIFTTTVPLPAPVDTFYHAHGDWFAWLCAGATLLTAFVTWRTGRRA